MTGPLSKPGRLVEGSRIARGMFCGRHLADIPAEALAFALRRWSPPLHGTREDALALAAELEARRRFASGQVDRISELLLQSDRRAA